MQKVSLQALGATRQVSCATCLCIAPSPCTQSQPRVTAPRSPHKHTPHKHTLRWYPGQKTSTHCAGTQVTAQAYTLQVAARWLSCCLCSTSVGKRNTCIGLLAKLLARIKAAAGSCSTRSAGKSPQALASRRTPNGATSKAAAPATAATAGSPAGADAVAAWHADAAAVLRMRGFCQWLNATLVSYLYPGATYERKFFALEVLNAMLALWPPSTLGPQCAPSTSQRRSHAPDGSPNTASLSPTDKSCVDGTSLRDGGPAQASASVSSSKSWSSSDAGIRKETAGFPTFQPYCANFLADRVVRLLLANAVDSWEKLRQNASCALLAFPTPLPGLADPASLLPLVAWAHGLLWSPRMREADAGARMLALVFTKYGSGLHWCISLFPTPTILPPFYHHQQQQQQQHDQQLQQYSAAPFTPMFVACHSFLSSILQLVEQQIQLAQAPEADGGGLLVASRTCFAHGPLLLFRYVCTDINWATLAGSEDSPNAAGTRALLRHLVDLLHKRMMTIGDKGAWVQMTVTNFGHCCQLFAVDDDGGEEGPLGQDADEMGPEAQVITTAW
ncbi:hypothetical protein DUNSADRAFT_16153 [Dunaliella salina]|uniref:tRNA (32-2'-O)-methyltransferase regulator THADA-like TPR repeats region domain-containing protein n=1 Tax=Dunaliella salina TaxID=3046 RepID=A0ABQ7G4A7_DUNSA|nr:hypothetical protein DUNSADRAFT_16153 [Dunaliella salina]|eukprot:KAF5829399.1 hypothetical protein DUNSADRAFT_16153 [Dunaliella salina]